MRKLFGKRCRFEFSKDESGAVTVDWVVLSAAVIIGFFAAIVPVSEALRDLLNETGGVVESVITLAKSW